MELRCDSRIHGVLDSSGRFVVRCHSKRCGHGGGTVVEHYFDPISGVLLETRKFQEPKALFTKKEERAACLP